MHCSWTWYLDTRDLGRVGESTGTLIQVVVSLRASVESRRNSLASQAVSKVDVEIDIEVKSGHRPNLDRPQTCA